jgi:nuclear-control-of-ATPase protein 2
MLFSSASPRRQSLQRRAQNTPLQQSIPVILGIQASSIRSLLSRDTGRPGSIIDSIFPHLHTHPTSGLVPLPPLAPFGIYSSSFRPTSTRPSNIVASVFRVLRHTFSLVTQYLVHFVTLPVQLANHEIHTKRLELERIRNERAEALGELTSKRDDLSRALRKDLGRAHGVSSGDKPGVDRPELGHDTVPDSMCPFGDMLATTSSKVVPMHMSLHRKASAAILFSVRVDSSGCGRVSWYCHR